MTARTASTFRNARRSSTFVALSAAALLAASCGTGEDTPVADGPPTATDNGTTSATTSAADDSDSQAFATADLVNADGEARGTVEFAETDGGTWVTVEATDLPPGFHGLHVHSTGKCEPDSENPKKPEERGDFLSSAGHLEGPNGQAGHPEHAGDLPSLYVTEDGRAHLSTLTDRLDRDMLLDDDGSAVIIHEDMDNFAHIPERYAPDGPDEDTKMAGDGGSRLACGALTEQG